MHIQYPLQTYLKSVHGDVHCVPYLCPRRGHQEFRTFRSSWKKKEQKNTKKTKVIVPRMESESCRTPVLSQRERDKHNFLSIKVTEREAREPADSFIQRTVLNLFPFGKKIT